jgi:hypothetical protein
MTNGNHGNYDIYTTDTTTTLSGGNIEKGEWAKFQDVSSTDSRKPASYAVRLAMDAAIKTAYVLAREQGAKVTAYVGTEPTIADDGRIAEAVKKIRDAVEARARKLASQPPAPQFACANARHGCRARVHHRGEFCARCAHDEE